MGIERATYQGTYRAGVIGHTGRGNYGHGLDVAFVGLPNVRLVAVADADDEGRAEAMGRTGAERAYADYRDMLAQENLDLVAIGPRWLDQHEAMTIAAAEAGVKAIYAEKPMAPSLEVADRMLAACDRHGVKIAYAHQNRAYPGPALVREYIAAGKLGRLRVIRAFGKQDRRGGGMDLLVLGTHLLDLMRLFAGDARWCHGHVTRNGHDATVADVEVAQEEGGLIAGDDVIAQYGFDHGVLGTYECGRAGDGGGSPYFRVEVCGTDGMLTLWSSPDSPIYMFPGPFAPPDRLSEWQLVQSGAAAAGAGAGELARRHAHGQPARRVRPAGGGRGRPRTGHVEWARHPRGAGDDSRRLRIAPSGRAGRAAAGRPPAPPRPLAERRR